MHNPADGLHKIGLSANPEQRAKQVRAALLWQVRTGNMLWLERYLHVAFADCHVHGEWFSLPDDAVNMLLRLDADILTETDLPEPIRALHTSSLAAALVRSPDEGEYRALKLDTDILARLKLAVGMRADEGDDTNMQELASDILNKGLAEITGRPPVNRKPPPPKPRGVGRPRKPKR